LLFGETIPVRDHNHIEPPSVANLIRCGIISVHRDSSTEPGPTGLHLEFSTPAAKRVVLRDLFPRSSDNIPNPENIDEWLLCVLEKMSAENLRAAAASSTIKVPKEGGFQQEFFSCAIQSLHPSIQVIPEMSAIFKVQGTCVSFACVRSLLMFSCCVLYVGLLFSKFALSSYIFIRVFCSIIGLVD
jgi:hypothetical protein